MNNKSLWTDQPQPEILDPLLSPTSSLRSRDTQGSKKTGQALDIAYFFVEGIAEEEKK
jgi:hypothetical protein